jgi:hypothetical protein
MNHETEIPVWPPCGLYQTHAPMPDHEENVPAGHLVRFHNHSRQGPPILLLPEHNRHNTWYFHERGYLVTSPAYAAGLRALLPQGLCRVREHFHPSPELTVERNTVVQLGYTITAEPILFFGNRNDDDGSVRFADRGMKIDARIYGLLEPLGLRGPQQVTRRQLH